MKSDRAEIDEIVGRFFAAFDNRDGRSPDMAGLRRLFAEGAVVVKASGGAFATMTVDEFIAPRAALLTGAKLTEFHEWEVASHTSLFGGIAWRQCTYRKAASARARRSAGWRQSPDLRGDRRSVANRVRRLAGRGGCAVPRQGNFVLNPWLAAHPLFVPCERSGL